MRIKKNYWYIPSKFKFSFDPEMKFISTPMMYLFQTKKYENTRVSSQNYNESCH